MYYTTTVCMQNVSFTIHNHTKINKNNDFSIIVILLSWPIVITIDSITRAV